MFVIGIDPHRGSHAAAVLDGDEQSCRPCCTWGADRQQRQRLLAGLKRFVPRLWAVEGATGTGALLAQQLVAAGEPVVDVPPKLAARVRLLDNNHSDKTDSHDARSTAIVALRNRRLRRVSLEDHTAVLRLLAKRHHDLIAARTRAICRLHTTVCFLVEGHLPRRLRADGRRPILRWHPPDRRRSMSNARRWPGPPRGDRRLDRDLADHLDRLRVAVTGSGTTLTRLLRGRADRRRLRHRLQRRRRPVPQRRPLRPLQRHRPDRSLQRPDRSAIASTRAATANLIRPST